MVGYSCEPPQSTDTGLLPSNCPPPAAPFRDFCCFGSPPQIGQRGVRQRFVFGGYAIGSRRKRFAGRSSSRPHDPALRHGGAGIVHQNEGLGAARSRRVIDPVTVTAPVTGPMPADWLTYRENWRSGFRTRVQRLGWRTQPGNDDRTRSPGCLTTQT
jgi:hypothetical protein